MVVCTKLHSFANRFIIAKRRQFFNGDSRFWVVEIMKKLKIKSVVFGLGSVLVLGGLTVPTFASEEVKPKPRKVEYVRFLDLLPKALMLDKGIENASFGFEAAKETQKASRSGWYPKADITLNSARQEDYNRMQQIKSITPLKPKLR